MVSDMVPDGGRGVVVGGVDLAAIEDEETVAEVLATARVREGMESIAPFDFVLWRKRLAAQWVVREFGLSAERARMLDDKVRRGHREHGDVHVDVDGERVWEIVDLVGYTAQRFAQEGELAEEELGLIGLALQAWDLHDAIVERRRAAARAVESGRS